MSTTGIFSTGQRDTAGPEGGVLILAPGSASTSTNPVPQLNPAHIIPGVSNSTSTSPTPRVDAGADVRADASNSTSTSPAPRLGAGADVRAGGSASTSTSPAPRPAAGADVRAGDSPSTTTSPTPRLASGSRISAPVSNSSSTNPASRIAIGCLVAAPGTTSASTSPTPRLASGARITGDYLVNMPRTGGGTGEASTAEFATAEGKAETLPVRIPSVSFTNSFVPRVASGSAIRPAASQSTSSLPAPEIAARQRRVTSIWIAT